MFFKKEELQERKTVTKEEAEKNGYDINVDIKGDENNNLYGELSSLEKSLYALSRGQYPKEDIPRIKQEGYDVESYKAGFAYGLQAAGHFVRDIQGRVYKENFLKEINGEELNPDDFLVL